MVEMLQNGTQLTSLHKVRAHANIEGNEKADELAEVGRTPYSLIWEILGDLGG